MENKIGEIICELRKMKGLTQGELALYLGVAKSTISNYENNIRKPDTEMLKKLAEYFGVQTDYLLGKDHKKISSTYISTKTITGPNWSQTIDSDG